MKTNYVTIKDIARQLGVSASTVSRALKDHPDISKSTKDAVQELAEKLNYQPNALALSLKHRSSKTIGVIIPEIVHFFFSSVISGIEDVAYEAGFTVIICQSNEMYSREVENTKALIAHRVDGILISVTKNTSQYKHLENIMESGIPMVFFDRIVPEITADQVIIDDEMAAYKATKHLIDLGRKRILHFSGPSNLLIGRQRLAGYLRALKEAGMEENRDLIVNVDSYEGGFRAIRWLIDREVDFDGLFAVNDSTAIGAMHALQNHNISIPQQVAIIGFSDGRLSSISRPTLSSVDQHGYEMGSQAMLLLLERINATEDYPAVTKKLETNLVIRSSSSLENKDFFANV
ncbi:MAG: LacI family DNA-binding transcriptional regulator [Bacteroidota bacterium]